MKFIKAILLMCLLSLAIFADEVPSGKPEAGIDLATNEGAGMVKGQWKYSDTKIVEVDFKAAGPSAGAGSLLGSGGGGCT